MLSLKTVRDDDLLRQLARLVKQSRRVEAEVVAHIAEVERRRLYARQACSSMFEYCSRILRLRENEAYLRITVARASRQYPVLLEMLDDGRLHLSGIARLAPHLTRENAEAVIERACGMSHREIRELVAELEPRPDVAAAIRRLPERAPGHGRPLQLGAPRVECDAVEPEVRLVASSRPALIEPLAPSRYQVRFTASAELRDKLERLQALMCSSVPDGDLGRIIEIAVSEKLQRIEARRFGQINTPRSDRRLGQRHGPVPSGTDNGPSSRHVPAAVRRQVYARDGGRCAYRNREGLRCGTRHDLEYHHRHPFAHGGDHSPANLALMCRAHNALLAEQDYGEDVIARFRAAASRTGAPVDAYGAPIVVQPRRRGSG